MEEKQLTGYPSIDKPWLKYYSEEAINAPLPECTAYELLYNKCSNFIHEKKLAYCGRKFSYEEIFAEIEKYRLAFINLGVCPGNIIAFSSVFTPELVFSFYALNRIGAIMNVIDPRTKAKGLQQYFNECNCKFLFCLPMFLDEMLQGTVNTQIEKVFLIDPTNYLPPVKKWLARIKCEKVRQINSRAQICSWAEFILFSRKEFNNKYADFAYRPNYPCCIAHTGGTTGTPKGVLLTNDNFNGISEQFCECNFGFSKNTDVFLNVTVPFVAFGMINAMHHFLCERILQILVPIFTPEMSKKELSKNNPTIMLGAPSYFQGLLQLKRTKLKYAIAGAEAAKVEYEKEINEKYTMLGMQAVLMKGYGMTEVSACATVSFHNECNKVGGVGVPLCKTNIAIIDQNVGTELSYDQLGEICITGPGMMLGYYENEAETENIKRLHEDGLYWIHSGDIGYMDTDGQLYIVNRIKRIFTVDGFKVYPVRLEELIRCCLGVQDCAVVGVATSGVRCDIVAYIVKKQDADFFELENQVVERLERSDLADYYTPARYIYIDHLPINAAGKIDYRALEQLAAENA